MPNWCYQQLDISGTKNDLVQFAQNLIGHRARYQGDSCINQPQEDKLVFTLNKLVPVPADVLSKPYSPDYSKEDSDSQVCGYYWQRNNWGTKWDWEVTFFSVFDNDELDLINPDEIENFKKALTYGASSTDMSQIQMSFETAWSPIFPWLTAVSKQYPNLTFELEYADESFGFCGNATFKDGDVQDQEYDNSTVFNIANYELEYAVEDYIGDWDVLRMGDDEQQDALEDLLERCEQAFDLNLVTNEAVVKMFNKLIAD